MSESQEQTLEELAPPLRHVVEYPSDEGLSLFVHGVAGTGKTTALQRRLLSLLAEGASSYTILTVVAQPSAVEGFRETLIRGGLGHYSDLQVVTFSGLARELVALFWPLIAGPAGFVAPHLPPTFLSYELAQVQMEQVIAPLRADGAFEGLRLRPQQLLSQLLDNLNRAALNCLSLDEMEDRLVATWNGDSERRLAFHQAADAARHFRSQCLESNSLDVSLVIDVFQHHLVGNPVFRDYFTERYHHLLVDNAEEMPPAGAVFLRHLLPGRASAVVAYDDLGGYRRFLAADPDGAWSLHEVCSEVIQLPTSHVAAPELVALGGWVYQRMTGGSVGAESKAAVAVHSVIEPRYRREMMRQVVEELSHLQPATVAIVVPYLDQAASYALSNELTKAGLPYRILRRRGNPRDEPLVRAWLTLAALAHPHWRIEPTEYDVAEGLKLAVSELDWPRAVLATQYLYNPNGPALRRTDVLTHIQLERLGASVVADLAYVIDWIGDWSGTRPLDHFFRELFNDLWSQVRSGDNRDRVAEREAAVCNWLAEKAGRFRRAAPVLGLAETSDQARALVSSILQGLVTGDPLPGRGSETVQDEYPSVLIATIYAYLLSGPVVDYQVWLDGASMGWWDIPRQPLSNAFVLTPHWPADQPWTEADSFAMRNQLLARIVHGLCVRCRKGVLLTSSELDERGERQDGPLWRALMPLIDADYWKRA